MSEHELPRKRRRPAMSCIQCRKRKIKCDRSMPCSNCTKHTPPQECDYYGPPHQPQHPQQATPPHPPVLANLDTDSESHTTLCDTRSAIGTPWSTQPVICFLPGSSSTKTSLPPVSDAFYIQYDQDQDPETAGTPGQSLPRLVSHKTRVFGQSHWINPCITLYGKDSDLIGVLARSIPPQAFANLHRCKSLARTIKARRSPPWPTIPTRDLPPKDVADALVERYFETSETFYRVLHGPSFRQSYVDIWDADVEDPPMDAFVQVKLVLAIGATTYDDEFSLRSSAARWIHEAMTWNSSPNDFKARLTIRGLQNSVLIILAQSFVGVGRDLVWPGAASLLRCAMHMGLHRDPSKLKPASDIRTTELRRRLWNTILELTMQTSIDFTETTVAIVFRQTLSARLAIVHFLNGLPAPSPSAIYRTTLSLDAALRAAYASLSPLLRPHSPTLAILHLELLIHRYLVALHVPFLAAALIPSPDPSPFLYSRTSSLAAALRIWSTSTASSVPLFTRFASNAASFLRASSVQAVFVVTAELRAQLFAERESLVPTEVRPDLVRVMEQAEEWALKCVRGGETNVKGYLFIAMVRAQLEALRRGVVGEKDVAEVLGGTAQEAGGGERAAALGQFPGAYM
ncbi:hypothetical protein B0T18DRAFT_450187 [Schizothecium vesticola]|uniref:Zn(2)-C6 fungal-type domain-containing protein n=1 Tax=Schizothecium vesticola TaxID=314040 RepID=A0AA40BPU8_9PEZI|nr:hypothetical protein B0T18DRAFT_450187 [Schizothecium vesticola]